MLELRTNFKQKHLRSGLDCELGCMEEDSQEHLLSCDKIPDSSLSNETLPKYEDLFSFEVNKQLKVAAVMKERMVKRKEMRKEE